MKRRFSFVPAVLAVALTLLPSLIPTLAHAQPAAALGHPLPGSDLPNGTVTVRVIGGAISNPMVGIDVTLDVGGTPRVARTDAAGRATFAGLPAGTTVQAKVDGEEGPMTSDAFAVPDAGGARIMLSTKAMGGPSQPVATAPGGPSAEAQPGVPGGGGPMAGGGMPEPRTLSGTPRPDPTDPGGQLTVRLTYDDLTDATPPKDLDVTLVGYVYDDTVKVWHVKSDAAGRATFTGLDRTGGTAYYAMALMPRGPIDQPVVDRVMSQPVILMPAIGTRLMLSAAKRGSTDPAIDDLTNLDKQPPGIPGGQVRVVLEGVPSEGAPINLVDASNGAVLATSQPVAADPGDADQRARATLVLPPGSEGKTFYAETTMRAQRYRSVPFVAAPASGTGTSLTLYVLPRALFSFSLSSEAEDAFLGVRGRFEISNNSWAPYRPDADGILIPLPLGHKGAVVADTDAQAVSVDQGVGFRVLRPVPPGNMAFRAGFSLPIDDGEVAWKMDLPLGAWQSGIEIAQTPGMHVELPAGVRGEEAKAPSTGDPFFVLPEISILPRQSMVMTITGLPADPSWKRWAPRAVGILVIGFLVFGLTIAMRQGGARERQLRQARIDALLEELVELERTNTQPGRRAAIRSELESLWPDDDLVAAAGAGKP